VRRGRALAWGRGTIAIIPTGKLLCKMDARVGLANRELGSYLKRKTKPVLKPRILGAGKVVGVMGSAMNVALLIAETEP
jgi:hypothetical protein